MDDANLLLNHYLPQQHQMRLAVITETYPPEINGVAMTTGRLVSAMQQLGHWIELIRPRQHAKDMPADQSALEEILHTGVPIPRYGGLKFGLPAKRKLVARWRLRRPDLVHVVTEGPLGWSAIAAAKALKIPVTSDFHTNFHTYSQHYGLGWLQKPVNAYLRKFHNQTLATFVPTQALADELGLLGYRNLRVVSRGVDTALFNPGRRDPVLRRAWGLEEGDIAVLYVGRIAAEKNLPLVFDAFEAMQRRQPGMRLILVGDGPQRATWEARYRQHVFAGMRVGEDLARHYASGDVFLFPSLTETFGNVTLEAMASGLAVVAYDYAAAREHVRSGDNGLLASFNQPAAFVAVAEHLVRQPDGLQAMRARAVSTAAAVAWSAVFREFETYLLDIVNESGALL